MIQNLQPVTYLIIFIFAGIAWAGLLALAIAAYGMYLHLTAPKPTKWEKWEQEWAAIEKEISR